MCKWLLVFFVASILISSSRFTNIETKKWVNPDLFESGSLANEFMQNEEDEIALVEAVVDYETESDMQERPVVS